MSADPEERRATSRTLPGVALLTAVAGVVSALAALLSALRDWF